MGSDLVTLEETVVVPSGIRHAVDADGQLLCRRARARFSFPALAWMGEEVPDEVRAQACSSCASIALTRAMPAADLDAYPQPAQPAPLSAFDWLTAETQVSGWSAGLSSPGL